MAERDRKNYIAYADIARIAAAFAVVLLHVAGARLISVPIGSEEFFWAAFFDCAMRWSVPLFVMLSGMLFLNKEKQIRIKTIYTKNILRMVTAFIFWSYVYNVYTAYAETRVIAHALKLAFFRIPQGAMHTWFLFVIVGLYIVLPFVKRMTENMTKSEAEYFIILSIILTFLPKTLSSFEFFEPLLSYINKFEINYAAGYVGLFVAGWYIDTFSHGRLFRLGVYCAGMFGFIYMFWTTVYFSFERGVIADEFMSFKSLSAFLMAFAVMLLLKSMYADKSFKRRTNSNLAYYSKYTFGIYLVHELILNITAAKGWVILPEMPYIGICVEAVIIFVISGLITGIITALPWGKYIA